ncbi:MAG: nucleoside hydrolase [Microbacteriaceae bacterium]|nr:nucleoside hydrolase [Microbacteriaceae bacterium]
MRRIPLVIDTDTAQDDCIALLVGLLDPRADLRAITMVAGNVGFERQVLNAHLTLSVAGRLGEIPLYLGCRRPLVREWVSAEYAHGDGVGGLTMDFEGLAPEREHAVDALIALAAASPGEITVVCIGPLTNIAMAAIKDPRFVADVKALVVMGGSNNARGNITAAAEYNFYVDPEAAETVFHAGFASITVVPWAPLTLADAVFPRERLAQIAAIDTPLARFYSRVVETTLGFNESVGIHGSTHPDSLAAAVLLHPEIVTAQARYAVDVETGSHLTRGYAAMSWGVHGLEGNATVVESVDAEGFADYLVTLLSTDTVPSRALR